MCERRAGQAETERQARAELGCRAGRAREKAGRSAVGPLGMPRSGKREERSGPGEKKNSGPSGKK